MNSIMAASIIVKGKMSLHEKAHLEVDMILRALRAAAKQDLLTAFICLIYNIDAHIPARSEIFAKSSQGNLSHMSDLCYILPDVQTVE